MKLERKRKVKEFLKSLIEKRSAEMAETEKKFDESENIDEVRELGKKLEMLKLEIADIQAKLDELNKEETEAAKADEAQAAPEETKEEKEEIIDDEEKKKIIETRSNHFNIAASYGLKSEKKEVNEKMDKRSTLEYRSAFRDYVCKGIKSDILEYRSDATSTTSDMGVLFPIQILQEVQKGIDNGYGSLYAKVRHLAIPAGCKIPLATMSPICHRLAEDSIPSDTQAMQISGAVEFGLRYMEVRCAISYLVSLVSVEAFEEAIVEAMRTSMLKEIDSEIISGRGGDTYNEFTGILTEANKSNGGRVTTARILSLSAAELQDWKSGWAKKVFGKLPIALTGPDTEFVMTNGTFESLKALSDDTNHPLILDWFKNDGNNDKRFYGHPVTLIANDVGINSVYLKDIDSASVGDYVAIIWVPSKAYCVNEPEQITASKYRDERTMSDVLRMVAVNDGAILDAGYLYLVKRGS